MRKALIALAMLGSLSVSAMAADLKVNGGFGYRFDSEETSVKSEKDQLKAELVLESKVNDKVKAVVGLRTGGFNSPYNDFDAAGLENVDLHLAYVEYAALDHVKVKLGKMHQPWATSSSLFFDRDVKPEGVAVAYNHGSGLFANLSSVKLVEGGVQDDSRVQSLQVGLHKKLAGLHFKGGVALHDHNVKGAAADHNLQQVFGEVGTAFAGKPVVLFADWMKNDKANADDTALAYGVKFGNAKKPQEWDLSVFKQDVEANAQYGLWIDSDIAGNTVKHDGYGLTAGYVVLDGWKVNAKYFDVERGASKEDYKRLQLDLIYMF
jgi:hypothetical protein